MHRIFIPPTEIKKGPFQITNQKAHYLNSVLRCKKGDNIIIFDGQGNCFEAVILKSEKKIVVLEIKEKISCDVESKFEIILVQGLLKGSKMDLVIQKSTELGVKEIIPAITERSQLRETDKIIRWRKIAEEASRQSGRVIIPLIHEPIEFKKVFTTSERDSFKGFIFYEEGGMKLSEAFQKIEIQDSRYSTQDTKRSKNLQSHKSFILHHASSPIHIFIGPEGGFTREEVNYAEEKGLIITSLGKRILRSETAAIVAMALVQFLLGDLC